MTHFTRVIAAAAVVGALLSGLSAVAQPAPSSAPTISGSAVGTATTQVTIFARKRSSAGDNRQLTLNTSSGSSCGFMEASGTAEAVVMQGYMDDYYGANRGVNTTDPNEHVRRFSTYAPGGDASNGSVSFPATSTDANGYANAGGPNQDSRTGCTDADYRFAAGRAFIRSHDTSLRDAYGAFDAKDYTKAHALFGKAWNKIGYPEAGLMLAEMDLYGIGVTVNPQEAITWLKRISELPMGVPEMHAYNPDDLLNPQVEATVLLAKIYLSGWQVPRDANAARHWYERASNLGYAPAAHAMGLFYRNGYGVTRDVPRAVGYFKKAGKVGYAPSQYALGEIYYNGDDGVTPNKTLAGSWLIAAAKQGHPDALYAVGRMYDLGEGGASVQPDKALTYYKEAAVKGQPDAEEAIGMSFYTGEGLPKDAAVARRWFLKAAEQGNPDAMFDLAVMLANGEGGSKDSASAYAWFTLAAESGLDKAGVAAKEIEGKLTPDERARADSVLHPKPAQKDPAAK